MTRPPPAPAFPPGTSCWRSTAPRRAAGSTLTLVRDVVRVVSVEQRLYDRRYGYVKIKNFQDRTDSYLKKALDSLRAQAGGQLAGVVLDLRHNPGGLLDQAVKVADRFLVDGVIVSTKGRGSVQTVIELEDGSGLKLTIARYYTPSGRSIQEKGITPDLYVRQQPGPSAAGEDDSPRERNLPNHFKAEEALASVVPVSATSLHKLPQQPGDPIDDFQLKSALDTLRTWQIFRATLLGHGAGGTKAASATP